jgi:hypothetical protein
VIKSIGKYKDTVESGFCEKIDMQEMFCPLKAESMVTGCHRDCQLHFEGEVENILNLQIL